MGREALADLFWPESAPDTARGNFRQLLSRVRAFELARGLEGERRRLRWSDFFSDPTLTRIGEAHGKSVAQVALRWLVQRGVVAIPKSVRKERMAQSFDVFDFELTAAEMEAIAGMGGDRPEPVPRPP